MAPLFIDGMRGLGDGIYQRPFVRAASFGRDVYLTTPWPELYADLPRVRPVKPATTLRTQSKNIDRQDPAIWCRPPPPGGRRDVRIAYGHHELRGATTISQAMEMRLPLRDQPFVFDLPPDLGPTPVSRNRPYIVVRPVTVRTEWRNEARNPLPEYVAEVAEALRQDYRMVSIADLAGGAEALTGEPPPADLTFHAGEIEMPALLALLRDAAAVIGGVGWIVPASIAARVPAFVVLGGHGGHNAPARIVDPRMDAALIGWAKPDRFCCCTDMRHRCDKRNSNLAGQLDEWRRRTSV